MSEKLTQVKLDEMVLKELDIEAPKGKEKPDIVKRLEELATKGQATEVTSA